MHYVRKLKFFNHECLADDPKWIITIGVPGGHNTKLRRRGPVSTCKSQSTYDMVLCMTPLALECNGEMKPNPGPCGHD